MTEFEFTVYYFKRTGGAPVHVAKAKIRCRAAGYINPGEPGARVCPNIHDAVQHIRGLRDNAGPGALPGRTGDGWDGFIVLLTENAVPGVIPPPDWNEVEIVNPGS